MTIRLNKLSFYFTLPFLFLLSTTSTAQMVGFESEFATAGFLEPQWGSQQLELSKQLLSIVKNHFNNKGKIISTVWAKYPEKNLKIYKYIDPNGGVWAIDPEAVNTTGLDGVEFVTPPLASNEEITRYENIMKDFRKTKSLLRGIRSSNHITIDISHLLQDPNDVSNLVDLILTIENHWAEIYRFFDPVRYGTIINRFSVPLAVDQQDLLLELAALPKKDRSYINVRNIFTKYDQKEALLRDPDEKNAGRKWKYRAANYGKMFQIIPNTTPIRAIEFRLGDLDFGSRIQEKVKFFQALVNKKSLDSTFVAPFGMKPLDWKQASANLKNQSLDIAFLNGMVSSEKINSIQKKYESTDTAKTDIALLSPHQPIEKAGKFMTLGFEAEFKHGTNAEKIIDSSRNLTNNAFPYLDSSVSREGTGNIEIRSIGGERILSEVLSQMSEVRSTLKEDLRGFHMHIRIPKEIIDQHEPEKLKAWLTAASDAVFAWRLQNRRHFFALKTMTLSRQALDTIEGRGPLRLSILDDGVWDIEIRGYMTSLEMIGLMAQKIMTAVTNPEIIGNKIQERYLLSQRTFSLQEGLQRYNKLYLKKELTDSENLVIKSLEGEVIGIGLLPLYDFTTIYGDDPRLKRKIQDATMLFFKETMTVINNAERGKYTDDKNELSKQFRWRIKRWAQAIDLQNILEEGLFTETPDQNTFHKKNELVEKINTKIVEKNLKREDRLSDRETNSIFKRKEQGDFYSNIEQVLTGNNIQIRRSALLQLYGKSDERSAAILEQAARDPDSLIRGTTSFIIRDRSDPYVLPIIKILLNDSTVHIRTDAATALAGRSDAKSFTLIKKALKDKNLNVRAKGLEALIGRTEKEIIPFLQSALADNETLENAIQVISKMKDADGLFLANYLFTSEHAANRIRVMEMLNGRTEKDSLALVAKGLKDKDPSVRQAAIRAMAGRSDLRSLSSIEKYFTNNDPYIRAAAIAALGGRSDKRSLTLIENAIADTSEVVQTEAITLLTDKNLPIYLLKKAIAVKNNNAQILIENTLNQRNDFETIQLLQKMLGNDDLELSRLAASILVRKPGISIATIKQLLDNTNANAYPDRLLLLLNKLSDQEFIGYYHKLLNNSSWSKYDITNLKRSYNLRFGSLKAKPTSSILCEKLF